MRLVDGSAGPGQGSPLIGSTLVRILAGLIGVQVQTAVVQKQIQTGTTYSVQYCSFDH